MRIKKDNNNLPLNLFPFFSFPASLPPFSRTITLPVPFLNTRPHQTPNHQTNTGARDEPAPRTRYQPGCLVDPGLAVVPRRDSHPVPSQSHHGARVQHTEAEEMVEFQTNAVHVPVVAVLGVEEGVPLAGEDRQVLDVSPGQVGAGEEAQN